MIHLTVLRKAEIQIATLNVNFDFPSFASRPCLFAP